METSRLLGAVCASIFSFISVPSHAALVDNGGGLIYDSVLDITWAQPDVRRHDHPLAITITQSLDQFLEINAPIDYGQNCQADRD